MTAHMTSPMMTAQFISLPLLMDDVSWPPSVAPQRLLVSPLQAPSVLPRGRRRMPPLVPRAVRLPSRRLLIHSRTRQLHVEPGGHVQELRVGGKQLVAALALVQE